MNRKFFVTTVAAVLTALAAPAEAFFVDFLDNSPVASFTDADRALLDKAWAESADKADGTKTDWENKDTGHRGSVTPLNRYERDGRTCRAVRFHNEAEGLTSEGTYELCGGFGSEGINGWKFTGAKPLSK